MAYSLQLYTGDGNQTLFTFSFEYLDKSHVFVKVDGVDTSFTFNSSNAITITPAPAVDSVIEIYRVTPKERLVDYLNGSIQDAEDFDLDSNQLLYLVLEGLDEFTKSLSRVPVDRDNKMYVNVDMNNFKVTGLGEPTDDNDAVRLIDVQNIAGIVVTDASETEKGIIRIATSAEVDAGTDDATAVTPAKLRTEINSTYADSVAYTDSAIVGVESSAVATANAYTDGEISTLTTYVDAQDVATLDSANDFASTVATQALIDANAYTDNQIAALPAGDVLIGDVKESYATLDASWLALDNSAVSSTTYSGLKAVAGFDKVSSISSSYDPTGRTGFPVNVAVPARSTSYSLVIANNAMYYESAPNVWTPSSAPEAFLGDANTEVVAVDGNNVAARSNTTGNVLYSTDGGATFAASSTGALSSLSVLMYSNGLLIAIASSGSIVYVSTDNGATWENVDAVGQTGLDNTNTVPTNSGFAVFATDVIYVYDVVNTPAGVFITNTIRHRISAPSSSQLESVAYNAERNTIAIIYNDNDTVDTAVIVSVDLNSQKSYSTYVEVVSETFLTIHRFIWIGGDTYVISHNNGVTYVTIENGVSVQQISKNVSTQIPLASFASVTANKDEGYVVCARTSGGISYFDIFSIVVDVAEFYLPHNSSVGTPKYIKAS